MMREEERTQELGVGGDNDYLLGFRRDLNPLGLRLSLAY